MKLIDKISFTGSIISFMNISCNRSRASYYLINKYTSTFTGIYIITN